MDKRYWGFYSAQFTANGWGTFWYSTPDGREVEVSTASPTPEAEGFKWPDKVSVGEITKFLYPGQPVTRRQ